MVKIGKGAYTISCYGNTPKNALKVCRKQFGDSYNKKKCLNYSESVTSEQYKGKTKYLVEISFTPKNKSRSLITKNKNGIENYLSVP